MRRKMRIFMTVGLFLLALNAGSLAQAPTDPLWLKAVELFKHNENWVPGKVVTDFTLKNSKGEIEEHTITVLRVSIDEKGEIKKELVSLTFNGEDKTDEAKEKGQTPGSDKDDFTFKEAPFYPANQDKIIIKRTSEKEIDGKRCIGFEYTLTLPDITKSGTIWLDMESGAPVLNVFTPAPLPKNVKRLENRVTYHFNPDGAFYISKIEYDGEGGMLFIKKNFHGEMTFRNFRRREMQN